MSAPSLRERLLDWADLLDKAEPFYEEEEFAEQAREEAKLLRDVVARLDRLDAWHEASVPIVAALAIYGEGVGLAALVEKARALNEAEA